MAGLEERTGLGWRLLLFVPLSTLATVAALAAMISTGAGPGAGAFTLVFGTLGAVMHWPITLPGAVVAWVLVWHFGWRLGLAETTRALSAACAAAFGAVAGLRSWWSLRGMAGESEFSDLSVLAAAAVAGGLVTTSLLYLRQRRPDGGNPI